MNPQVDESLCSACSICSDICPEVFEMGDDGFAKVINPAPGADLEEKVKEAKDSCPSGAISC